MKTPFEDHADQSAILDTSLKIIKHRYGRRTYVLSDELARMALRKDPSIQRLVDEWLRIKNLRKAIKDYTDHLSISPAEQPLGTPSANGDGRRASKGVLAAPPGNPISWSLKGY